MQPDDPAPDDLRGLQWPHREAPDPAPPGGQVEGPSRDPRPATAGPGLPVAAGGESGEPEGDGVRGPRGEPGGPSETTLAAITMRIDALGSAAATFRTIISDRLNDYADQVARIQGTANRDLEEFRREYQRGMGAIERGLSDSEEGFRRLQRGIDHLGAKMTDGSAETARSVDRLGDQLQAAFEERAGGIAAELRSLGEQVQSAVVRLEEAGAATLRDLAGRLEQAAGASERHAEETARVTRLVTDLVERTHDWRSATAESAAAVDERLNNGFRTVTENLEAGLVRLEEANAAGARELAGRLEEANAAGVRELAGRLEEQGRAVDAVAGREGALVNELRAALERLEQAMSTPAANPAVERPLARIEAVVAALADAAEDPVDEERLADRLAAQQEPIQASLAALEVQVAEVAGSLAELRRRRPPAGDTAVLNHLRRLEEALGQLSRDQAGSAERLTGEVEGLRRRIAIRARPAPLFDDAAIDALAAAVAERLETPRKAPRRPRPPAG